MHKEEPSLALVFVDLDLVTFLVVFPISVLFGRVMNAWYTYHKCLYDIPMHIFKVHIFYASCSIHYFF